MGLVEGQINSEKSNVQPPTFKEWLLAVLLFPVTIQRLVVEINQLTKEVRHLDEVGQDFNEGLYKLGGGKVSYKRPNPVAPDPDLK